MKNREYHIKIHSNSRFIISSIIILCSSLLLIDKYTPRIENELIIIIQFLSIFFTSIYLAHIIGMAKAKVIFTKEAFIHNWERKFLFSWENNIIIPWEIVDNYVFLEERTYDSFIINLTTKQRYKIDRLNFLPLTDDFKRLVKDFPRLSNEYRMGIVSDYDIPLIREGQSIYASKSFKWIFYLLTAGFLVLALTKMFDPESETTWSTIGALGCALLFYGSMIIRQNKK